MSSQTTLITIALLILISTSCSLKRGYVLFENQARDEIFTTEELKSFLTKHQDSISIVLKVPNTEKSTLQSDPNSKVYNLIEKELLKAGFNVRDRGLFTEVLKSRDDVSYEKLHSLTQTDLILELVYIDDKVTYATNTIHTKQGKSIISKYELRQYGASFEFKLILVEKNQFAGSYTFKYNPCPSLQSDCKCEVAYKANGSKIYPNLSFCRNLNDPTRTSYTTVQEDELLEFVRVGVHRLLQEMLKYQ